MSEPSGSAPSSSDETGRAIDPSPRLALPAAIIGAAGGWLTADMFRLQSDASVRWLLTIITPLVAAGLGAWLAGYARRGPCSTAVIASLATAVAGVLNGAVIGLFVAPPVGAVFGVVIGALCSMPFMPAIIGLSLLARRIGRARHRSIVDGADRRMVWVGALAAVALVALVPDVPAQADVRAISTSLPLFAAAAIGAVLLWDLIALARVRVLAARTGGLVKREAGALDAAPVAVDFGLGDEQLVALARKGTVYRAHDEVTRVVRGNAGAATRAIAWSIAVDAAALAIALGASWARSTTASSLLI